MPSRVRAPGDPTAPASAPTSSPIPSSSAMPPVAPSSASAMDCSVASQVRRPAPDALPKSSASSSGKKARLHGPDLGRAAPADDDDVDMRSPDERKAEANTACPPSTAAVRHPAGTVPALVSSTTLSAASSSLPEPRIGASAATVPVFFVCAGIARKTRRLHSMEQLTQDEASANEGNRHTTSQPTDCSIPSSSLPTTFSACSVRPHSVHRGDHGAVSSSYSSSLPSSSSSSCSSSLSPSLSVVSMPLSSSSCSTTAFCFALAACFASAACSARS